MSELAVAGAPADETDGTHPTDALIYDANGVPTWTYRTAPFRAAFERSGLTAGQLAAAMGFSDPAYPTRLLGLRTQAGSFNKRIHRPIAEKRLSYSNAAKLARALGLDLIEWCI